MRNKALLKRMRTVLKILKKKVTRTPAKRGDGEWLNDNYYILEREARAAITSCTLQVRRKTGSDLLPSLFNTCKYLCNGGVLPTARELADYFSNAGLSGAQANLLRTALRCALLDYAADACEQKSGNEKLMGNVVKSIKRLKEIDFEMITEESSEVEKILLTDPAGIYIDMDAASRSLYRASIVRKSLKTGISEVSLAKRAVEKASEGKTLRERHIGHYIVPDNTRKAHGTAYIILSAVIPLIPCIAAAVLTPYRLWALLLWFPLWEALRPLMEMAALKAGSPTRFLRLNPESDDVRDTHTLITVSTLLPSPKDCDKLKEHLAQLFRSNATGNIKVCCLADFKSAPMPNKPEDTAALAGAQRITKELNDKFGGGFILAVRPRVYSKTQNEFTGKGRKMGAISELVKAIGGDTSGFKVLYGDTEKLSEVKYLFALDSDTQPVFDTAAELLGIALHPQNRAAIDKKSGKVTSGYGVIVPGACTGLAGSGSTPFMRLMGGDGGITAYDSLCGELYQDLFGEGIFSGKGLIDVEAYAAVMPGKLPKERVLSHDIVEGGLLRAGFASDMQIIEGFPKSSWSYFARLDRWVRGDWQNSRFIFSKNPLNALSRYKLFDNLRRSITPVISVAVILLSVFFDSRAATAAVVIGLLSAAAPSLLAMLYSLVYGGFSVFSRLYYSKTLPAATVAFMRALLSIVLLFRTAFCCLKAISKALWRMLISKRNLLEWTTAAQSESKKTTASKLCSCIPTVLCAAFLFIFGLPVHRLTALLILPEVLFTMLSGREDNRNQSKLSAAKREKLISYAAPMWQFFEDNCNAENNFLPPDNIQQAPVRAVAHRTSPTNIGLMLLCCLAARDLGFITTAEMYVRLNLSLQSIEKLEKFDGNLLNWYSTKTLEPLSPRFVSTVDSGNFLCCLTALRQGIGEYTAECPALVSIVERISAIIEKTDLTALYNQRRKLFYIGIDCDTGMPSESCYDLYMSEARMTAYYAVARREVSKKHWGALGRIPVGLGRYTGLVSWTGTMFEYYMPHIFIPAPQGSLSYESLRFCLWCQQKRTGSKPWGISESGFYAFDSSLNYQYKAHGVQAIGLKRDLNTEKVIAPYASFLTLSVAPNSSIKNLERLEKSGFTGRYGFYEAIDYTSGRCPGGGCSIVSSFMSHHIGMSLLSIVNVLNDNSIQRRFISDGAMAGAQSLLLERIPAGATVFKNIGCRDVPKTRERTQGKSLIIADPAPLSPEVRMYSAGRWATVISDIGTGVSMLDAVDVTCRSEDILRRPQGVFAYFSTQGGSIPFTCAPDYSSKAKFKAEFYENQAVHRSRLGNIKLKMVTQVMLRENCEQRTFTVENSGSKGTVAGNLVVYFEPCLTQSKEFAAHPAFSRLFVTDEIDKDNKLLVFSRRARENENEITVVTGFLQDCEVGFEVSREKMLISGEGIASLTKNKGDFDGKRGNPDACAALSVPIRLKAREKAEFTLIIAAGETRQQAVDILLMRRTKRSMDKFASDPFYKNMLENAVSGRLLPSVFYPSRSALRKISYESDFVGFGMSDLWSFGVSGENPIILIHIADEPEIAAAVPYVRINKKLRTSGVRTDLVISFNEETGYSTPLSAAVRELLRAEGCEAMLGVSGGVHIANMSNHTFREREALEAAAVYNASLVDGDTSVEKKEDKPVRIKKTAVEATGQKSDDDVKQFNFTNGKIDIYKTGKFPYIPWCLVLCNQNFGTMVSDKALGFTWALNSRENRLTPWHNDTRSDNRGEMLLVRINGEIFDLLLGAAATFTPNGASWSGACAGMEYTVQLKVALRGMTKRVCVDFCNTADSEREFELAYYLEPDSGEGAASFVCGRRTDAGALFYRGGSTHGYSSLVSTPAADFVCFDRGGFLCGDWNAKGTLPRNDACVVAGKKLRLAVGGKQRVVFDLSWARTERASLLMPSVSDFGNAISAPVQISTPDKELDTFFNSFLYSQIKNSRFYARAGFYQCGGAWGFRDQLQDSLAFVLTEPQITRTHILRCAAVQFEQGDVLHWWHTMTDGEARVRGVRTRCSDDLLWLPYVCGEYVKKTGDAEILNVKLPYIYGDELEDDENERYFSPKRTAYGEPLLEHCLRAVDLSLTRIGEGGLPLIGSCDWNDGFSRVGAGGKGESVWLAQFMVIVLEQAQELCRRAGRVEKLREYARAKTRLILAIEDKGFAGDRYLRAFYDDGTAMGSNGTGGALDILPQAFAVFARLPDAERCAVALKTACDILFCQENDVIRLLAPPFGEGDICRAGYIAAYPEGIRENGGQYTHAAVWLALALIKNGRLRDGYDILTAINPLNRWSDDTKSEIYRAEPYVLAGDVSFAPGIEGRAGWTHYTGAAAWYYRTVLESVLGISQIDGKIDISPNLPQWCKGVDVVIKTNDAKTEINISNSANSRLICDSERVEFIPIDGQNHTAAFGEAESW